MTADSRKKSVIFLVSRVDIELQVCFKTCSAFTLAGSAHYCQKLALLANIPYVNYYCVLKQDQDYDRDSVVHFLEFLCSLKLINQSK